jgi:hypothetical protein
MKEKIITKTRNNENTKFIVFKIQIPKLPPLFALR